MTQTIQPDRGQPNGKQDNAGESYATEECVDSSASYPDLREVDDRDDEHSRTSGGVDLGRREQCQLEDKRKSRVGEQRPGSRLRYHDSETPSQLQQAPGSHDQSRNQRQSHLSKDPEQESDRRSRQHNGSEPAGARQGHRSDHDHRRQQSRTTVPAQGTVITDDHGQWEYVMTSEGPAWAYAATPVHGPPVPPHASADVGHEAKRLRQERNDLKDDLALTTRELERAKAALKSLQDGALSSVDRFSPLPDGTVEQQFLVLAGKIKALGNFLTKSTKSSMEGRKWASAMRKRTWPHAYADTKLDPTKDTDFRKLLWRLVLWSWIDDAVVRDPFQAFGGAPAETMHDAYNTLFRVEQGPDDWKINTFFPMDPEAAKWRSISVNILKQNGISKFDEERKTQLRQELDELLKDLGSTLTKPSTKGDFDNKVNAVITAAMAFAQSSAGQRAVYQVFVPRLKAGEVKTLQGSTFTSIDDEFGTADEEEAGEILYVGRPGLLRRGSPMGQDFDKDMSLLQKPFAMLKIERGDD